MSYRGRGRDRGRKADSYRYHGHDSPAHHSNSQIIISIDGFVERPQLSDIGRILSGKTRRRVRWNSCKIETTKAILTFDSNADARAILRISNLTFKGAKLVVSSPSDFNISPEQRSSLFAFIGKHYDPTTKFLDLSHTCDKLREINVDFNDRGFVDCVCSIIAANCSDLLSLRIDANNIATLSSFVSLSDAAPNLVNLSLSNNRLSSFDELSFLSGYASKLRELMLSDNRFPDMPTEIYAHMAHKYFKELRLLDQKPFTPLIQFDVASYTPTLPTTLPHSFDPPDTESLAKQIIMKYFNLFDASRDALSDFYHENSHFSMAIDTSLPNFLPFSRNLLRVGGWSARAALLQQGPRNIVSYLRKMPSTQHLSHTFAADVTGLGAGMLICVAGHLIVAQNTLDFHRAFLLTRTAAGSFVIQNDHLHLSRSSSDGSKPMVSSTPAIAHNAPPVLNQMQRQITMQLAEQAGVQPELAYQALKSMNGDAQQALIALRQHRSS